MLHIQGVRRGRPYIGLWFSIDLFHWFMIFVWGYVQIWETSRCRFQAKFFWLAITLGEQISHVHPCSPYLGCPLQPIPPYLPISTGWAKDTLVSSSQVTYHVPGFHSHQVQSLGTFTIDGILHRDAEKRNSHCSMHIFDHFCVFCLITDLFYLVGCLEHLLSFHFIYGMSSWTQLTFIFFKMVKTWFLKPPTSYFVWAKFPSHAFWPGFFHHGDPSRTQVDLQDISQQMLTNRRIRLETGTAFWLSVANSALRDGMAMQKNDGIFWGEKVIPGGGMGSWLMLRSLSFFVTYIL